MTKLEHVTFYGALLLAGVCATFGCWAVAHVLVQVVSWVVGWL